MLIKALCDYYDLKTSQTFAGLPEGYSEQPVHFQVLLRENGEIAAINDYRVTVKEEMKSGKVKEKLIPREIGLPERKSKSGSISEIVEHRGKYLFGLEYEKGKLTTDTKNDNARKSHEAFVKRHSEFFADLDSPICRAFRSFVNNWNPEEQTENEHLKNLGKDYSGAYFCFALYDDITKTPQDDPGFLEKYQNMMSEKNADSSDVYSAVCPVMGERLSVAKTHDKIKLKNAKFGGCPFVSMNENAYESYGKTQSYNSNISEAAMKKYTAAFNDLLSDKMHRVFIDSMVIVFFALKQDDSAEAGLFSALFGASEKGDEDLAFAEAMNRLKRGAAVDYSALGIDENVDIFIVGFTTDTPKNASRICPKFIVHNSFGKIMENAAQHQRDMALAGNDRQIYFGRIAKELISPKSTKEEVSPPLITGIIRAAIEGTNYPEALLQTVIMRVKTDNNEENNRFIKINDTRVGIIKACLNRKARKANKKEEITMALNKENTNAAYLCGRLFAVLEKIQLDSIKGDDINTTILYSYFTSACSRPSLVFPKLNHLSIHHMKKLSKGLQIDYNRLMNEICRKMEDGFPSTLNTPEQGEFIIGYRHQNDDLWTPKNDKNNNDDIKEN